MFAAASLIALSSVVVTQVAAHGGVLSYSIGGNWFWGWQPYNSPVGQTSIQRPWSSYNPIQDATVPTLACNDDGTSGALQLTTSIKAGQPITAYWNQIWPHNTGPMLTYLAQCPGTTCTGVNANTLKWFKIQEAGLLSGTIATGDWAAAQMIAQNSSWTTTIPTCVPTGNYLIRFETIALHSLPAQMYPECAQLSITNGGTRAPAASELVTFPGAYSNTDPGLTVNLYTQEAQTDTTYVIPGPPLYTCGAPGSSQPPVASTTSSKPVTPTTSSKPVTPTTSSKPPTTTSSSAPPSTTGVAHYGQCGGIGWAGGVTCASPYTCTVINAYYSQCI
ncbi:cellulose-growth-specific protein [Rickenella mellea]|uniref:AA9 family lytic polysaccharide monooxygenase n=1 Tax=Rickenella mellea TaxID=50990 RepID=A0A4Y7Q5U4_9AGAM|nr:cellulose-growth-specific protein [Rickenella mellea]